MGSPRGVVRRRIGRGPLLVVVAVAVAVASSVVSRAPEVGAGSGPGHEPGSVGTLTNAGADDVADEDDLSQRVEANIVGGTVIDIETAPWQVLVFPGAYICGGSVYSSTWIITAAHCVEGFDPVDVDIAAGIDDRSNIPDEAVFGVDTIIIHPGWDSYTFENDIALVELSEPLTFGPTIAPIALPTQDPSTWPPAGTPAFITGFGSTSWEGPLSPTLRGATVQVTVGPGSEMCADYPSDWYFRLTMMCAGVPDGGVDTCQGDSGGPVAVDASGTWYLAGITSFGYGCALAEYPGISTRVTTYVAWIVAQAVSDPSTTTTTTTITTTITTTTSPTTSTTAPPTTSTSPTTTTPTPTTTVPPIPTLPEPNRVAGADRFTTAVAVSEARFAPGVEAIYVATGRSFADALTAGLIAGLDHGPILLVEPTGVSVPVADEIRRLRPERIVIVGGLAAVSDVVRVELERIADMIEADTVPAGSVTVSRVAGPDRYATATALSQTRFDPDVPVVYIASGEHFADALSAVPLPGRAGGPVLLVRHNSIPGDVAAELRRLAPRRIVIVGGSAAVSDEVASDLTEFSRQVSRIAGSNRFGTSVELSRIGYVGGADTVFLTNGLDFPDALGAGPVAIVTDGPILLVRPGCIPAVVQTELERLRPSEVVIVGGPAAVSAGVAAYEVCLG